MNYNSYAKPETYFVLAILIMIGALSFLVFLPFLSTIILAAILSVIVHPLHKRVLKLFRGRNTLSSGITLTLFTLLIIIPLFLIAAQVFNEATSAYYHIKSTETTLSSTLDTFQLIVNEQIERFAPGVTIDIRNYFTSATGWVFSNIGTFFSGTISVGLHLFLAIFALFYFIKDGKHFISFFKNISPLPEKYNTVLINKLRVAVRSIIGGSLIVALCQGIASGIAYAVFGLPNPALWGVLTGLAALVPGLGTSIVMIPAIIFVFVTSPLWQGIGLTVVYFAAISLIDNFLSPKLIGNGLNIHPLVILFSILGGLTYFGPEGFILGPLTLALFFALFDIYRLMTGAAPTQSDEVINETEINKAVE